jgi:hypothetical protein
MGGIGAENWIIQSKLMNKNDKYLLDKLKNTSVEISRSLENIYAELSKAVTTSGNKKVLDKILKFIRKSIEYKARKI